ncbi:lipopolysaccharide biosynthesis protein, partial [Mesorhizobium sp. BR1-1-7]|nr:lipopolysaccharide biosynthesis protein [Mesorhizobium sp. BR1-1-7]
GRSGDFMRWGIITAVTSVLAFVLGLPYGALGVAIAYAVSEYLRTPFLWLYVGRSGPLRASHVLRAATPFVLGAHVALAVVWLVKPLLPQQHVIALASGAILAYLITIVIALVFAAGREALREALKMLPARPPAAAPREAQ